MASHSKRDFEEAFTCGQEHGLVKVSQGDIVLQSRWSDQLEKMDKVMVDRKIELDAMVRLNKAHAADDCCWKLIVDNLQQSLPSGRARCYNCNSRTFSEGKPELEHLTQVTIDAGDNTFYKMTIQPQ